MLLHGIIHDRPLRRLRPSAPHTVHTRNTTSKMHINKMQSNINILQSRHCRHLLMSGKHTADAATGACAARPSTSPGMSAQGSCPPASDRSYWQASKAHCRLMHILATSMPAPVSAPHAINTSP